MLPFYTINAPGILGIKNTCIAWVPLDDENTMVWNIGQQVLDPNLAGIGGLKVGSFRQDPQGRFDPYQQRQRGQPQRQFLPDTSDWLGRYRPIANKDNDYLMDFELQKRMGTYTGVPGPAQDPMAQETMGAIYDRTQERLGTTDMMIIRVRQKLINAAKAHDDGSPAPGVENPALFRLRGGGALVKRGMNGLDDLADLHFARKTLDEVISETPALAGV
jgi:hypothetical protein